MGLRQAVEYGILLQTPAKTRVFAAEFIHHGADRVARIEPQVENLVIKNDSDFSYELTLEPHGRNWLLALETPSVWTATQAQLTAAFQLVNPTPVHQRMSYRGRSYTSGVLPGAGIEQDLDTATILPAGSNLKSVEFARRVACRHDGE